MFSKRWKQPRISNLVPQRMLPLWSQKYTLRAENDQPALSFWNTCSMFFHTFPPLQQELPETVRVPIPISTRASFFVTGSIRVQLCGDAAAPAPRHSGIVPWLLKDLKSHKWILPSGSKTNVKNESWNIMDLGLSENYWLHLQIMAMVMGRIRINHRNRRYPFQTTQLSIRRYQTAKKLAQFHKTKGTNWV